MPADLSLPADMVERGREALADALGCGWLGTPGGLEAIHEEERKIVRAVLGAAFGGSEDTEEWAVQFHGASVPEGGLRVPEVGFPSQQEANWRGAKVVASNRYGIVRYTTQRRYHRVWPDGSSWTTPWETL